MENKKTSTQDMANNWIKEDNKKIEAMEKSDQDAKKNKTLVGRYIVEPIADGRSFYVITEANKQNCTVDHIGIGDAWTIPFVEMLDRVIPTKYVRKNVAFRDSWAKIWNKAKKHA